MNFRAWFVALVLFGCGGGTSPVGPEGEGSEDSLYGMTPPSAESQLSLMALAGTRACEDLEQKIEDAAVLEMRANLESSWRYAVQSWNWRHRAPSNGGLQDAGGISGTGGSGGAGGSGGGSGASAPNAFTTTNNQVQGVDEADLVKNDGTRIFVLSGRSLYTALSWPASTLARQGKLDLEGYPHEMLKRGDHQLVVFSNVYLRDAADGQYGSDCTDLYCMQWYANTVKVTVVDVSDLAKPTVVSERYFPGRYQTARLIGDSARVVIRGELRRPWNQLSYWVANSDGYRSLEELRLAHLRLGIANESAIRNRSLAQWLPAERIKTASGLADVPFDCSSVVIPNGSTELGLTSVVTMDLSQPGQVQRTMLLARSSEVYASAQSLYVASHHWWWGWGWWTGRPEEDRTYLHRFDISDPEKARYVASGSVAGYLIDQFAMDEHDGYLRVATTRRDFTDVTGAMNSWWATTTLNQVTVVGTFGDALLPVGQTDGLARNERIMSARFLGDKGYVVTFRQTDPLFTFDLSDPFHPTQKGELHVDGFSSYLHPIDDGHLLAMGTLNGSVQLSLYDVTDLSAPKRTFNQTLGTYSYSEAQWQHKAFNYFPAQKRLAVPYSSWEYDGSSGWSWSRFVSDLRVFDVDVSTGFTARGSLSMKDLYERSGSYSWSYYWMPSVRRSIMADEFVYAIGDSGIRVANVADLSQPVATVDFDSVR